MRAIMPPASICPYHNQRNDAPRFAVSCPDATVTESRGMDLCLRKVIHPQAHDNYRVILKRDGDEVEIGSIGISGPRSDVIK
jgi:hypothetical protein